MKIPKKWLDHGFRHHSNKEQPFGGTVTNQRKRGLGMEVNGEKVDRGGKRTEDKDYFSKVCFCRSLWPLSLSEVIKAVFLLIQESGEGHLHEGNFVLCL